MATRAANHAHIASCDVRFATAPTGTAARASFRVNAGTSNVCSHANDVANRSSKSTRARYKYCGISHLPTKSSPSSDSRSRAYASHASSLASRAVASSKGVPRAFLVLGPVTVARTNA